MRGVARGEHRTVENLIGAIFGASNLFEYDFDFACDFLRIKAGVLNGVGEEIDADFNLVAWQSGVVHGFVEARVGIHLTAKPFDRAGDFADTAACCALEEHVLVKVREAGFVGILVGAADLCPNLQRRNRCAVRFVKQDRESIRQGFAESLRVVQGAES